MASKTSSKSRSSTAAMGTSTGTGTGDTSGTGSGSTGSGGNDTAGNFQKARAATSSTTRATGRRISENPVGAVLGGFAVGAVLGAVIPTTARERRALQPVGHKVTEAARTAARQAADTGREKLNRVTGEVMTQVGSKMVDAVAPPSGSTTSA